MERTINKAVIIVLGGAILADILSNGQVSAQLATIGAGVVKTALQATSGQTITG